MYLTCNTSFEQPTSTIKCTGLLSLVDIPVNGQNVVTCSNPFTKSGQYLTCSSTAEITTYENATTSNYLAMVDTAGTSANGYINGIVNLNNVVYSLATGSGSGGTSTDSGLNSEYMQVMQASAFWFFAFGILLGFITSQMRKASHK